MTFLADLLIVLLFFPGIKSDRFMERIVESYYGV